MIDRVNVIGLGYIGLPTALILSASNVEVVGTDLNQEKIENLQSGVLTFVENGLEDLFVQARTNNIEFSTTVQVADVYIIAVPTPFNKITKKVEAGYISEAVGSVVQVAPDNAIIVVESTVSPGTIDTSVRPIVDKKNREANTHISIAHAPERIIPGSMIKELKENNRTIGADTPEISEQIKLLYSRFCSGEITTTDIRTAELSKVVENAYRDINIAYANELVKICREAGVDVRELIRIANKHPRVNILNPGPGVGGHCISVDPWFLVGDYPGLANIVLAARKINDSMPEYVLMRIREIMDAEGIKSVTRIGLYGLTYKENVDDIRESPTRQLLQCMHEHLAEGIKVYDPYITTDVVENQYHQLDAFLNDIDMVVIMVAHNEISENTSKLKDHIVLDTRAALNGMAKYDL